MFLAIDAGNTNAVLGVFDGGLKPRHTWRISTHPIGTADEFRAKLGALCSLDGVALDGLDSVVVSSVVPQFSAMLRNAFPAAQLKFIDHRTPFSFVIKAEPPQQVGADRLVNAEAVLREYGGPAIIVDSGTATTLCALSAKKVAAAGPAGPALTATYSYEYLGGAIMPGIELAIEALTKNTAKLFAIELVPPKTAIGPNTQEAMRSGILLGYASMVDGMVRRFKAELGEPKAKVVATGGISQLLKGLATELEYFDTDLTLKGIAYLHDAIRSR